MKKLLVILASVLLFAGCTKEEVAKIDTEIATVLNLRVSRVLSSPQSGRYMDVATFDVSKMDTLLCKGVSYDNGQYESERITKPGLVTVYVFSGPGNAGWIRVYTKNGTFYEISKIKIN